MSAVISHELQGIRRFLRIRRVTVFAPLMAALFFETVLLCVEVQKGLSFSQWSFILALPGLAFLAFIQFSYRGRLRALALSGLVFVFATNIKPEWYAGSPFVDLLNAPLLRTYIYFSVLVLFATRAEDVYRLITRFGPHQALYLFAVVVLIRVLTDAEFTPFHTLSYYDGKIGLENVAQAVTLYGHGMMFFMMLNVSLLFWACVVVTMLGRSLDAGEKTILIRGVILTGAVLLGLALYDYVCYPSTVYFHGYNRIRLFRDGPAPWSQRSVMLVLWCFITPTISRRFRILGCVVGLVFGSLTLCRNAVVGLATGLGAFVIATIRSMDKAAFVLRAAGCVAIMVVTLSLVSLAYQKNYFSRYFRVASSERIPSSSQEGLSRENFYGWGLGAAVESPLRGLGPRWINRYRVEKRVSKWPPFLRSYYLDLAVVLGMPALLCYLFFFGAMFGRVWRSGMWQSSCLPLFMALAAMNCFDSASMEVSTLCLVHALVVSQCPDV